MPHVSLIAATVTITSKLDVNALALWMRQLRPGRSERARMIAVLIVLDRVRNVVEIAPPSIRSEGITAARA
jgi:hypothetical protein